MEEPLVEAADVFEAAAADEQRLHVDEVFTPEAVAHVAVQTNVANHRRAVASPPLLEARHDIDLWSSPEEGDLSLELLESPLVVVVLEADATMMPAVAAWLTTRGLGEPLSVLGAWHLPFSGEQLADFAREFPALRY